MTSERMLVEARMQLRQAKNLLRAARRRFEDDRSFGEGNLDMIGRVKAAERLLQEKRARLRQLDPTSTE